MDSYIENIYSNDKTASKLFLESSFLSNSALEVIKPQPSWLAQWQKHCAPTPTPPYLLHLLLESLTRTSRQTSKGQQQNCVENIGPNLMSKQLFN